MFRDRAFNLSIVFSFLWHLFWLTVIGVVITPSIQLSNAYQEVDFLGPILEKTAFDIMVENVKPQAETLYAREALFIDNVYLKPKGPERKVLTVFSVSKAQERFTYVVKEYIRENKEIPTYFSEDLRMIYAKRDVTRKLPFVEGPIQERELIFKPQPVTVPRGLYSDDERYIVKVKFFVSENGIVRDVEPLQSSGYPEIDLRAIRFVKNWRFSPGSTSEEDNSSWGVTSVTVEAR